MKETPLLASLLAAALLVVVHVATPALRFLRGTPRSIWLSMAGGVSVAYVFVHLLPELAAGQRHLREVMGSAGGGGPSGDPLAERLVWLVALAGLAIYYGLERLAQHSRAEAEGRPVDAGRGSGEGPGDSPEPTEARIFWIHIVAFGVYNALVGYLLRRGEREDLATLALFTVAMGLHFVVADFGLEEHHQHRYRRAGRWVLVAAVLLGVALGAAVELREATLALLTAFLGGGIVLNVLKEELPSERQSRFWAFAAGVAGYAALLLAL